MALRNVSLIRRINELLEAKGEAFGADEHTNVAIPSLGSTLEESFTHLSAAPSGVGLLCNR